MQFLSDIIGAPVDRPVVRETTALGAAYLAGLRSGLCPDPESFGRQWSLDRRFSPSLSAGRRDEKYARWKAAVDATIRFAGGGQPS